MIEMNKRFKLRQQVQRGVRAKRIMEDDLIKEAFDALEKSITDGWQASRAGEQQERDNAYIMHRLLQNFKQQFVTAIATGKVARKELLGVRDPSKLTRMMRRRQRQQRG